MWFYLGRDISHKERSLLNKMPQIKLLNNSNFQELKVLINLCSDWRAKQEINEKTMAWKEYYTPEKIKEKLAKNKVYGLFQNDFLIGVVSLGKDAPDYYELERNNVFYKILDSNPTYLSMLAVNPKFHKNGFASILLDFSEKVSKQNSKSIRIDILKEVIPLKNFYEKRGYKIVKEMSDNDDTMNYYEKEI